MPVTLTKEKSPQALEEGLYFSPHVAILFNTGSRSTPFCVKAYSLRGGTSAYVVLVIMPACSSEQSRAERVRGLTPPVRSWISPKRVVSFWVKARKIFGVHLSPRIELAASMQPESIGGNSFFILYRHYYTRYTKYS